MPNSPANPQSIDMTEINHGISQLTRSCHAAWQKNLLSAFNGNASLRLANGFILITASGSSKGSLTSLDFICLSPTAEIVWGIGQPSSESVLHLDLYAAFTEVRAILHTHPPKLQALALALKQDSCAKLLPDFLNMDIYEVKIWRKHLGLALAAEPGSPDVGKNAVNAVKQLNMNNEPINLPSAIWMQKHGLCALGKNSQSALGISEEMEHLADIQLSAKQL